MNPNRHIKIARHPADHRELLVVLLAEDGIVRREEIEKFEDTTVQTPSKWPGREAPQSPEESTGLVDGDGAVR